ncbi:MAG: AAA family ATPase [Clostridiales bacterium]|nr:AAA family ATPase [Clostridiales bacterium]
MEREERKTKIITVANQKGGVGKTTTSVNLCACLAQQGKKILLLDIDPQGNATGGLGIEKSNSRVSLYDALICDAPIEDAILPTMLESLFIVPSHIEMAGAEVELVNTMAREQKLKQALQPVLGQYDYVFIDCPPSLGLLTLNALTAADALLVPIQCEYYALEGLSQLMNTVRLVRRNLNASLDLHGVVMTMFSMRANLCTQVVAEVKKYFKQLVYDTMIPRSIRLGEAPGFGLPISLYAPKNVGARAYAELAREFIEREEKHG